MSRDPKNGMPDPGDLPALARWLNANTEGLIRDLLAQHTERMLEAMKEIADDRRRLQLRVETLERENARLRSALESAPETGGPRP